MLVNAHDHLPFYKENLGQALAIIQEKEIFTLAVSQDKEDFLKQKEAFKDNPLVACGLGIHPWSVDGSTDLTGLEDLFPACDFIGEVGLDFYWEKREEFYDRQVEVLAYFIQKAGEYQKVLNLHTKGGEEKLLDMLQENQAYGHLIHWYSGPLDLVPAFLDLGSYFTISVDVGRSEKTDQLIDLLPLDRILTESDGPTSLDWVRGEYGWPDSVEEVLAYIAKRKKVPLQVLENQVEENFFQCFHFPKKGVKRGLAN